MKTFAHISVIGRDQSGVVARVTQFLFAQKSNIEGLEEKVTRGQFGMTIQASWAPPDYDFNAIRAGLASLAKSLGMEINIRTIPPRRRQRLAILVTREWHCLDAILKGCRNGFLQTDPVVVIGNHAELGRVAKKAGLPFQHVRWDDRARAEKRALQLIEHHEADFIVLARFMKILSPTFVWRYKNKIINVHPSLLPSFPGPSAYRQAYEHGVKVAGVTSHFVSMHLDEGPIIAQASFNVRPGMSLEQITAAGQRLEARVLVKAIRIYLTKRLDVYWGTVKGV